MTKACHLKKYARLSSTFRATLLLAFAAAQPHAQAFDALAVISSTMGVGANRICIGEGTRGDIGCPTYAPSVSTAGILSAIGASVTTLTVGGAPVVGTSNTTMLPNWPDAIACTASGGNTRILHFFYLTSTEAFYRRIGSTDIDIVFNPDGSYASQSSMSGYDCINKSVPQLYAEGKAFNFVGHNNLGTDAVPAGAVMAFNLSSCPAGWSEYAPARGRFIRGIDNGAGNDPSGTRAAGNIQNDALQEHIHYQAVAGEVSSGSGSRRGITQSPGTSNDGSMGSSGAVGNFATETRPKNVALLYCYKM
jgi:hypothetical protein